MNDTRSTSPSLGDLAAIAARRQHTPGDFPPASAFIDAVWLDVQAEIDAVRLERDGREERRG